MIVGPRDPGGSCGDRAAPSRSARLGRDSQASPGSARGRRRQALCTTIRAALRRARTGPRQVRARGDSHLAEEPDPLRHGADVHVTLNGSAFASGLAVPLLRELLRASLADSIVVHSVDVTLDVEAPYGALGTFQGRRLPSAIPQPRRLGAPRDRDGHDLRSTLRASWRGYLRQLAGIAHRAGARDRRAPEWMRDWLVCTLFEYRLFPHRFGTSDSRTTASFRCGKCRPPGTWLTCATCAARARLCCSSPRCASSGVCVSRPPRRRYAARCSEQ